MSTHKNKNIIDFDFIEPPKPDTSRPEWITDPEYDLLTGNSYLETEQVADMLCKMYQTRYAIIDGASHYFDGKKWLPLANHPEPEKQTAEVGKLIRAACHNRIIALVRYGRQFDPDSQTAKIADKLLYLWRSYSSLDNMTRVDRVIRKNLKRQPADMTGKEDYLWLSNGHRLGLLDDTYTPNNPADYITQYANAEWKGAEYQAKDHPYDKAIADWLPDPAEREYVEQFLGYCLTGRVAHPAIMLHFMGEGRNGKSTLLELVADILGDYATAVQSDVFFEQPGRIPSRFSFSALEGKRFACNFDADAGKIRAEIVKQGTSNAEVSFERKGIDAYNRRPTAKLCTSTNGIPTLPDMSNGTSRRIAFIEFVQTFADDATLHDRLREDTAHILARWVRALRRLAANGWEMPAMPERFKQTAEAVEDTSNPVLPFIQKYIEIDEEEKTDPAPVYMQTLWERYTTDRTVWSVPYGIQRSVFIHELKRWLAKNAPDVRFVQKYGRKQQAAFLGLTLSYTTN